MSPGQPWLFPGYRRQHTSSRQLHRIVCQAAARAGITKRVGVHTLRHYLPFLTMSGDSVARGSRRARQNARMGSRCQGFVTAKAERSPPDTPRNGKAMASSRSSTGLSRYEIQGCGPSADSSRRNIGPAVARTTVNKNCYRLQLVADVG